MFSLILAVVFLSGVIFVLRTFRNPHPLYITSFVAVIATGFIGITSLTAVIPLWSNSLGMAIILGLLGVAYVVVAAWGVSLLKRHHG